MDFELSEEQVEQAVISSDASVGLEPLDRALELYGIDVPATEAEEAADLDRLLAAIDVRLA